MEERIYTMGRKSEEAALSDRSDNGVQDTLDNLIQQFSDVFCLYRELIQNSLDAGTNRVDVYLELLPDQEGGVGIMVIHIDDYGEGMNREIIDTQLTRLFSSSKEGDYTKIGKFGIGFVSVFAIQPDAVSIDTSRDGEDWRVLFDEEKKFERIRLDHTVDGTKIKIIKRMKSADFQEFRRKSREAIVFWCKHSEAEIYFHDEPINLPFDIDSPCKVTFEAPGTQIVMGYTAESPPFFGFYNKGLTLLEGRREYYRNISFKIRSRYIEHTLTRDNVIEDENFFKAMQMLHDLARNKLRVKLLNDLETLAASKEATEKLYEELIGLIPLSPGSLKEMPPELRKKKIFPSACGGCFSTQDIIAAKTSKKLLLYDHSESLVTRELKEKGHIVARAIEGSNCFFVLQTIYCSMWNKSRFMRASLTYYKPVILEKPSPLQRSFCAAVGDLLKSMSSDYREAVFGDFDYEGSPIRDRLYVSQYAKGGLSSLGVDDEIGTSGLFARPRALVMNANNEYINRLIQFSKVDRDLASYLLVKLLYLKDGIDPKRDSRLVALSIARECLP